MRRKSHKLLGGRPAQPCNGTGVYGRRVTDAVVRMSPHINAAYTDAV